MRRLRPKAILGAVALLAAPAALALVAGPASAANVSPSTTADGGPGSGSLRDVLENVANNGDTVVLQPGATYTLTLCGSGEITIPNSVTIDGGSGATITQTCPGLRIFTVNNNLTIRGVTITGGTENTDDGGAVDIRGGSAWSIINSTFSGNKEFSDDSGALDVNHLGTLTVTNSTFANNHAADDGGAIDCEANGSTMKITGSTFVGNGTLAGAGFSGGAIDLESTCTLNVLNSTFTGNNSGDGAAISSENSGDHITIAYSTIFNNTLGGLAALGGPNGPAASAKKDARDAAGGAHAQAVDGAANVAIVTSANLTVFGSIIAAPQGGPNCSNGSGVPLSGTVSQGFNFVDDTSCSLGTATDHQTTAAALKLGPLANNGGPTQTLLPQTGSPVIDAIPVPACQTGLAAGVTTDQRGVVRPQGPGCDPGAVEVVVPLVVQPRFTG